MTLRNTPLFILFFFLVQVRSCHTTIKSETTSESLIQVNNPDPRMYLFGNGSDETPASDIFAENVTGGATDQANVTGALSVFPFVQRALECGFVPVVSLIGAPVNVLNMLIFYRQGLCDKMNLCLFSLSLVDFLYVTSMLVLASYCFVGLVDPSVEVFAKWRIRKHVINFVFAFWYSSGALTSIIALERCICVVFPLKSGTILKTRTIGMVLYSIVLVIGLLCMIYALKHSTGDVNDPVAGKSIFALTVTDLYLNNRKPFDAIENFVLPSLGFITFIVVAISTVVTVVYLKRAIAWRQESSGKFGGNKRRVALVKMLVTVSCIYIFCTAPMVSLGILRFLMSEFSTNGKFRYWFYVTHRAGNVILMVNSSVNFFVYVKQSSRFRKELETITSCGKADGRMSAPQSLLSTVLFLNSDKGAFANTGQRQKPSLETQTRASL